MKNLNKIQKSLTDAQLAYIWFAQTNTGETIERFELNDIYIIRWWNRSFQLWDHYGAASGVFNTYIYKEWLKANKPYPPRPFTTFVNNGIN